MFCAMFAILVPLVMYSKSKANPFTCFNRSSAQTEPTALPQPEPAPAPADASLAMQIWQRTQQGGPDAGEPAGPPQLDIQAAVPPLTSGAPVEQTPYDKTRDIF